MSLNFGMNTVANFVIMQINLKKKTFYIFQELNENFQQKIR